MKSRKTIKVGDMLAFANLQLSRTDCEATKEFKSAISLMIEKILHDTNNYKGFRYLHPTGDTSLKFDETTHQYNYGEDYFSRKYY
jgi:hypothetical protein